MDYDLKCEDLKEFSSGAKRDNNEGKGMYELISPFAHERVLKVCKEGESLNPFGIERLAILYERGAGQKGPRNWEKGIPFSRCLQSAIRHLTQYEQGMKDEDHSIQSCWNLFCIMHFEEMIKKKNLVQDLMICQNIILKIVKILKKTK